MALPLQGFGNVLNDNRLRQTRALVFTKRFWNSPGWTLRTDLIVEQCQRGTRAGGGSRAVLKRYYGKGVRQPGVQGAATEAARDDSLRNSWVWIRMADAGIDAPAAAAVPDTDVLPAVGQGQLITIFLGRIVSDTSEIHHVQLASTGYVRAGVQTLTVDGPDRLLDRVDIFQSWWVHPFDGDRAVKLDWIPPHNQRGGFGRNLGNRSADRRTTDRTARSYVYGGVNVWDSQRSVETLVEQWIDGRAGIGDVNEDGSDADPGDYTGPRYTLSNTRYLQDIRPRFPEGDVVNVAQLLDAYIPRSRGLDWLIEPIDGIDSIERLQLTVVPFAARSVTYGPTTMPANPRSFSMHVAGSASINQPQRNAKVELDDSNVYDAVELIGDRLVVCFSLAVGTVAGAVAPIGRLIQSWSQDDEDDYRTAVGDDQTAARNDEYRSTDRFTDVFSRFVVDPGGFDFNEGFANAIVTGRADETGGGWMWEGDDLQQGERATRFQRQLRKTLPWLPLASDYNYLTPTPTYRGAAELQTQQSGELLKPMAFVRDPLSGNRYVQVEQLAPGPSGARAAGVAHLDETLGIRLLATPRHVFARNHWGTQSESNFNPDADGIDYESLVITVACETDLRLRLRYELPANQRRNRGTKYVRAEGRQMWLLAPGTVVGINSSGGLQFAPVPDGTIVRDDRPLMEADMPGLIHRWCRPRVRGVVTERGMRGWHPLVGQVLLPRDLVGFAQEGGLVTRVSWMIGDDKTHYTEVGLEQA